MISGTSKKSTKSGPSDPVFITQMLQKIQENMGTSLNKIIFHLWESEILKTLEGTCTNFFDLSTFFFYASWAISNLNESKLKKHAICNLKTWTFEHWNVTIKTWNLIFWKLPILKLTNWKIRIPRVYQIVWRRAPENDEDPRNN